MAQFLEKKIVLFLWISSFVINSIAFLLAYIYIPSIGKVTLKYNVIVGSLDTGNPHDLYYLPMFAFFVLAFNTILYFISRRTNSILPTLALTTSTLVSAVFFLALIMLLQFNS